MEARVGIFVVNPAEYGRDLLTETGRLIEEQSVRARHLPKSENESAPRRQLRLDLEPMADLLWVRAEGTEKMDQVAAQTGIGAVPEQPPDTIRPAKTHEHRRPLRLSDGQGLPPGIGRRSVV